VYFAGIISPLPKALLLISIGFPPFARWIRLYYNPSGKIENPLSLSVTKSNCRSERLFGSMRESDFNALLDRFALSPEGYRKVRNKAALPAIADCLVPGGYLVIGRKEQLPDSLRGFHPHRSVSCLYRTQGSMGSA
jgi:hypothetical protein